MYKKGEIKTNPFTLEILTPLHIGTGEKLEYQYDYIEKNGKPFVINKSALYDFIIDEGMDDDTRLYDDDYNIQHLVDISGKDNCGYALKPIAGYKPNQQINECIKDAYLKPYIPGSSLKGAIRTAIFGTILFNNNDPYQQYFLTNNRNKFIADKELMKILMGSAPKNDIFRAFRVSDIRFPTPPDPVLAEVQVENTIKGNVQTIFVEAINKQEYAQFHMSWDHFLFNNLAKWHDNKTDHPIPLSFQDLCHRMNHYSMRYLKNEIKFYDQMDLKPAVYFSKDLFNKIQSDTNNNISKAYIQMSWGAGWNNKTGNWLSLENIEQIRQQYKLGKGEGIFPRTRRLIMKNHQAETPGWFCISTEPIIPKPEKKTCSWVDETIEKLCAMHHSKPDDILRGKSLANEWKKISEQELQKQAVEDIKNRWREKGLLEGKPTRAIKKAIEIYGDIWEKVGENNEKNA